MRDPLALFVEALKAADDIIDALAAPIFKALDPLHPDDFLILSGKLSRALKDVAAEDEAKALKAAFQSLDIDWNTATNGQRQAALKAAKTALAERPIQALPKIEQVFSVTGKKIVEGAKKSAALQYNLNLGSKFNSTDATVTAFAAKSSASYVRDQYGQRADALSKKARDIVAEGLEKGHDRYLIGKTLREDLTLAAANRSRGYWEMIAGVHANRARTWGSLSIYEENGIEQYEFEAVLDEVTTLQCRLLHGRTFSVNVARKKMMAPEETGDPEEVTRSTPWLGVEKDDAGQHVYFKQPNGSRERVATVVENASGKKDDTGKFSSLSNGELEARGVTVPPVHGNAIAGCAPVVTARGVVPLRDVQIGDLVLTHVGRWRRVFAKREKVVVDRPVRLLLVATGRTLCVTYEHPVLVAGRGWVQVGDLNPGDILLDYGNQVPRVSQERDLPHAQNAPTQVDEEPIAPVVVGLSELGPVPLPVDLDSNAFVNEREVDAEPFDAVLCDGPEGTKEVERALFRRGQLVAHRPASGSSNTRANTLDTGWVRGSHLLSPGLEAHVRLGAQAEGPVSFSPRAPCPELGAIIGDLHLVVAASDGDTIACAPAVQRGLTEPVIPLDLADRVALLEVLGRDEAFDELPVGEGFRFHASAIYNIAEARYTGDLVDLSVEEDESFIAAGLVVHNCRSTIVPLMSSVVSAPAANPAKVAQGYLNQVAAGKPTVAPPALGLNKIPTSLPWGTGTKLEEIDIATEAESMIAAPKFKPTSVEIGDIYPSGAVSVAETETALAADKAADIVLVRTEDGKLVAFGSEDNALLARAKLLNQKKLKAIIVDAEKALAAKVPPIPPAVKAVEDLAAKYPAGQIPIVEGVGLPVTVVPPAQVQEAYTAMETFALDHGGKSTSFGTMAPDMLSFMESAKIDADTLKDLMAEFVAGKPLPPVIAIQVGGDYVVAGNAWAAVVAELAGVEVEVTVYTEANLQTFMAWKPKPIAEAQAALDALGSQVNLAAKFPGMASSASPPVTDFGVSQIDAAAKAATAKVEKVKISEIVFTTDGLPTSKISSQFAGIANGSTKPVVVKYNGKFYGFANQGGVVAADLLGAAELDCVIVDASTLPKLNYSSSDPFAQFTGTGQPVPAGYVPPPPKPYVPPKFQHQVTGKNAPTYTPAKMGEGRKIVPPDGAAKPFKGMKMDDVPIGDLPSGGVKPYSLSDQTALDATAALSREEIQGIRDFTDGPYKAIRCAERYTTEELLVRDARRASKDHGQDFSAPWERSKIDALKRTSANIQSGIAKAKKVPCVTFRGMGSLPANIVEGLIQSEEMTLGGTSSSAWSAEFVHGWSGLTSTGTEGEHRVMYAINHRTGVLVDASGLSSNPGEKEILFPRNAKFKVTGLTKTTNNVLVIYAEEIDATATGSHVTGGALEADARPVAKRANLYRNAAQELPSELAHTEAARELEALARLSETSAEVRTEALVEAEAHRKEAARLEAIVAKHEPVRAGAASRIADLTSPKDKIAYREAHRLAQIEAEKGLARAQAANPSEHQRLREAADRHKKIAETGRAILSTSDKFGKVIRARAEAANKLYEYLLRI